MDKTTFRLATAFSLCVPLLAAAQPDPADPATAGPPLRYASAFGDYKPWQDLAPGDWKALNEAVKGGAHGAHPPVAKPAPAAAPGAATPAAPASHAAPAMPGHSMHGGAQ